MNYVDEVLGVVTHDAVNDVDEYIVCSMPGHGGKQGLAHSTHTDLRRAKLAQIRLLLDRGIEAWIEFVPALGPPSIELQLDAEVYKRRMT